MKKVSVNKANQQFSSDVECQVIDVREYGEYQRERIPDARLMPLSKFEEHMGSIDHSKPVFLVCRSGRRAEDAARRLLKNGFTDVHVVEGGMEEWVRADLPTIEGGSRVWALDRQVRFAAGAVVLLGVALGTFVHPYLFGLAGFVGAGLVFSGVTDTCGMAMLLARMPWNQGPVACTAETARK